MKSNIWSVMKKDLDKIFKNPRTLFATVIMPGLILFLIYAFMGTSLSNETKELFIYIENTPVSFQAYKESLSADPSNIKFIDVTNETLEDLKNKVHDEEIDAVLWFEKDFDLKLDGASPKIDFYYNQNSMTSDTVAKQINAVINVYKDEIIEKTLEHNIFEFNPESIHDENKTGGQILSSLLPLLIITFVFAGTLGVGTDAIAGEKERGTLSTLLMAPIKKTDIIYGKILSTTLISVLTAISSFIGILASMPFAKEMFFGTGEMSFNYTIIDYLGLLALFVVVAFIASSLILTASTYGKSVKEATSFATPLYIVAMLAAGISMFDQTLPSGIVFYLIPIYSATLGLKGILSFKLLTSQFLLIVGSSVVFILIIVFILVRLFKSEKVIFSK